MTSFILLRGWEEKEKDISGEGRKCRQVNAGMSRQGKTWTKWQVIYTFCLVADHVFHTSSPLFPVSGQRLWVVVVRRKCWPQHFANVLMKAA